MKYACFIHLNEDEMAALPGGEMEALNVAHQEYENALVRSGQLIAAAALAGSQSTLCVRVRHGKPSVTDGPFAETKEQVAGLFLLEARDLNEAIQLAGDIPAARYGTVEVRPLRPLVVAGKEYWCMDRIDAAIERQRSAEVEA